MQTKEKKTAREMIQEINTHAEESTQPEVRVCKSAKVGECVVHQGDIYIHRLPDNTKLGELLSAGSAQVALGSGMGARHVAEGEIKVYQALSLPAGVRLEPQFDNEFSRRQIMGPVIVAKGPWRVTHPEHAHHHIEQEGVFGVTYQFDPRTLRRVMD